MMSTRMPSLANNINLFHPIKKVDVIFAAAISLIGLTLYIRTLAPGLLLGDSAEFQTLAYTLGMTHPTGYPIYLFLAHLFTYLPVGDMAWRVNLFSAFSGAITLFFIYLTLRLLVGWRLAAFLGTSMLASTSLFWIHSIVAEVYTLACAFITIIVFLILMWRATSKPGYLFAGALLGGLSLGVHAQVALLFPGIFLYLLLGFRNKKIWLISLTLCLTGVSIYAISMIALDAYSYKADVGYYKTTVCHSLSAWNMSGSDFDTASERLRFMWLPPQFSNSLVSTEELFASSNIESYRKLVGKEIPFVPFVLMLIGVAALIYVNWREAVFLLASLIFELVFALHYRVADFVAFFTPSFIFTSMLIGVGLGRLMNLINWIRSNYSGSSWFVQNARVMIVASAVVISGILVSERVSIILPAWQTRQPVFLGWQEFNNLYPYLMDNPQLPHDNAFKLVNSLENNSIVFTSWDELYSFQYVASLQQRRSNLDFYQAYPAEDVLSASMADFISSNIGIRPIYFTITPKGGQSRKFVFVTVIKGGKTLYEVVREK